MSKTSWLPASPLHWLCELLSLAAVLFSIAYPLWVWPDLPARIPTHFNLQGQPDGWGSRDSVWMLAGAALLCYVLLTLATRHPNLINVPFSLDRENPAIRATLHRMIITLKPLVLAMFPFMLWQSLSLALNSASPNASPLFALWLAAITTHTAGFLFRLHRLR